MEKTHAFGYFWWTAAYLIASSARFAGLADAYPYASMGFWSVKSLAAKSWTPLFAKSDSIPTSFSQSAAVYSFKANLSATE
jgi:hypothetical protein